MNGIASREQGEWFMRVPTILVAVFLPARQLAGADSGAVGAQYHHWFEFRDRLA